jgi:hypothetical protein
MSLDSRRVRIVEEGGGDTSVGGGVGRVRAGMAVGGADGEPVALGRDGAGEPVALGTRKEERARRASGERRDGPVRDN